MFAIFISITLFFSVIGAKLPSNMKPLTSPVQKSLITFDDISNVTNTSGNPIPNGYKGLNWENGLFMNGVNDSNPGTGYRTGVVSPPYVAFDGFGGPMAISSATASTFSINSFYSCAAWYDNVTLTIVGTRSGAVLYTKTLPLFMEKRAFIELNWSDLDKVYFNTTCEICCGAKHFTMDNLYITL